LVKMGKKIKNSNNKPKQRKQTNKKEKKEENEEKEKSTLRLILLALSVCGALLAYGRFMEIITRSEYGTEKERFKTTTVIVFIQSITCASVAAIILLVRGASLTAGVPLSEWLIVAVSYFGAHEFGTRAFRYLTFPVQTIFKACKSVPVMIGERIFAKKVHKPSKFIGIALLLIGIIIFSLNNPAKASKMKSAIFIWNNDTIFGLIMISLALSCDGVYSPYQNKITKDCEKAGKKLYPHHLMFNMNVWQTIFATIFCLYTGQFIEAIDFVQRHPEMLWNLLYFAFIAVFSNLCISAST